MPLMMRRCGAFGCPVQGFSGGRCGSSRRHCASAKSPRLTYPMWELRPETSGVCRHALDASTQLNLVRRLEAAYPTLEEAGCKVGIGVATGADQVFIAPFDKLDVEPDRKLPI